MKTNRYPSLPAIPATDFSLNITTATAPSVDSVGALKNRAGAARPPAKEAFPWLTRSAAPRTEACGAVKELTAVKNNRALAASPRAREQFAELARMASPRPEFTIAPLVAKNAAVLSSPRYREQHPMLKRGTTPGPAKGGASQRMESGK